MEVVSCLEKDGRSVVGDLRWGVYVVIEGSFSRFAWLEHGFGTRKDADEVEQHRASTNASVLRSTA